MTFLPGASLAQWREPPRAMQPAQQRYTDCRAVDGDTLACRQGRVRLRGVDTPERGESGYRAAQQELRRRTPGGTVTVVPHHRDRHGRIVGDVYSRGQNVGRSMNADGYSKPRGARR
ncbi:MAG: thermonuclease family protein [Roseomonas sp.]|nr:thermonuclease family protein [Roseomonas sp.]